MTFDERVVLHRVGDSKSVDSFAGPNMASVNSIAFAGVCQRESKRGCVCVFTLGGSLTGIKEEIANALASHLEGRRWSH